MPSTCTITGTIYSGQNVVAANVRLFITPVGITGELLSSATFSVISNDSGAISFNAIQGAQYNIVGKAINFTGSGRTITIPASASALLKDLVSVSLVTTGLTVKDNGSALSSLIGTFNLVGFTVEETSAGVAQITSPAGSLALNSLTDVVISSPASAQVLRYNGTNWVNAALAIGDVTGLTTALSDALTQAEADALYSAIGHNHTGVYEPANANIQSHISSTSNPHSVTKSQVGLGSVTNALQLVAANNLSDLVSAGDARSNLGLVIGTNVQAFSARLTEVATIGTALQVPRVNAAGNAIEYYTPTSGGTIDGSGAANRLAYWSDADTLTSSASLTFDGTTLAVASGATITSPGAGANTEKFGANVTAGSITNSVVIGNGAFLSGGNDSVAIGYNSLAHGGTSVAVGSGAQAASGGGAVAVGYGTLTGNEGIAIGFQSRGQSLGGLTVGYNSRNTGTSNGISIGDNVWNSGSQSVGFGSGVTITENEVWIFGFGGDTSHVAESPNLAVGDFLLGYTPDPDTSFFGTRNLYIGRGNVHSVPQSVAIRATGGKGTNVAGATLGLYGGASTGSAAGGSLFLGASAAGSSGTGANAATNYVEITSTGMVLLEKSKLVIGNSVSTTARYIHAQNQTGHVEGLLRSVASDSYAGLETKASVAAVYMYAYGSATSGNFLGSAVANNATVQADNIMKIGTFTNHPVHLGANDALRMTLLTAGGIVQSARNAVPTDSDLFNSSVQFYLDQSTNELKVKAKYSDGTVKTATIATLT